MPLTPMPQRLLLFGLGTSLVQVVLYYLSMDIVHVFETLLSDTPLDDPFGDYVVFTSVVLLTPIVLTQNLIAAVISNIKMTYGLMFVAIALYFFGWGEDLAAWPLR